MSERRRERFWLQPTRSFPEGAPDRAEYADDVDHEVDCERYRREWLSEYQCPGCDVPAGTPPHTLDCPERYRWRR